MLIKCANYVEFEVTSLWNCETICIFALEFKDPMAAHNNIAKSHFPDFFSQKKLMGIPGRIPIFVQDIIEKPPSPSPAKNATVRRGTPTSERGTTTVI